MSEKKGFFGGLFGRKKKQDETDDPELAEATEAAPAADTFAHALAEGLSAEPLTPDPEAEEARLADAEPEAILRDAAASVEAAAPAQEAAAEASTPDGDGASEESPAPEPVKKRGLFSRLRDGLSKTSTKLTDGVASIFTKKKLDDDTLEELEDLLITADLGVAAAARVTAALAKDKFDKEVSDQEVKEVLAAEVAATLAPLEAPLSIDPSNRPHVILVAGVNGAGKTTTIGKLAKKLREDGKSVMLAAGDTFRAAAIEQLQVWGERVGAPVIARDVGADAAGLAFDAIEAARAQEIDVLMIDTAGRLQNRRELMDELAKVVRVIKKLDGEAPHASLLVLDATVGQNALSQADVFRDVAGTTGLVMTKLDGTARGGVLVALADKHEIPIHFIGVGESVDDLQAFDARAFGRALAGLE
ncbi:MAG: signal recognition particle-docking protein FtsY [Pseudomonadota bacterium]